MKTTITYVLTGIAILLFYFILASEVLRSQCIEPPLGIYEIRANQTGEKHQHPNCVN